MRKLFLAVLLTIISGGVNAEWSVVGHSPDGNLTVYADLATIKKSGNTVKMLKMFDFKTVQIIENAGKGSLSLKSEDEYDCQEKTGRVLTVSIFTENMGKGATVLTDSTPGNKIPVPPGTTKEILWKTACGKGEVAVQH